MLWNSLMNRDIFPQIDLVNDIFYTIYDDDNRYKEHQRYYIMQIMLGLRNDYGWYFKGRKVKHPMLGDGTGIVRCYIETNYYTYDYYLSVEFETGIETCTARSLIYES